MHNKGENVFVDGTTLMPELAEINLVPARHFLITTTMAISIYMQQITSFLMPKTDRALPNFALFMAAFRSTVVPRVLLEHLMFYTRITAMAPL